MKKLFVFIFLTYISNISFSQKLLWTSEYGGQNSNGAIISYDLNSGQLTTPLSLEGNPMYGNNLNFDVDPADVDYSGGLTLGADGNYYGVNSHSSGVFNSPNLGVLRGGKGFFYRYVKATGKIEVLHSFVGNQEWNTDMIIPSAGFNSDVSTPVYTVLEYSPGVFYGIAREGGTKGYGGVWKYDMNTSTYSVIGSFNDPANNVGRNPTGALIKGDGNNIYGLNKDKGSNVGYLFKINTSNDQMTFVADIIASGWVMNHPHGQMVYNSTTNTIYGTKDRFDASSNWGGGVWSYQISNGTVTPEWTILFSAISTLGSTVTGIIDAPDGFMYVTTRFGGANGRGTIIKYSPSGNTYVKVLDFPSNFSLVSGNGMKILGTKIVGTCDFNQNGAQLWSFDVFSNNFQVLMNGTTTNPNHPGWNIEYGILIDNGSIVGRTRNGSLNGAGAIFSYNLTNGQPQILFNCGSRKGRTIIGEMTQISDSTFVGYVGKGGPFINSTDSQGAYELGGVAVFNLITGQTRILNNLLNNGGVESALFLRINKPLLASDGELYYSQLRAQPITSVAWVYSHDLNAISSPHFSYSHYNTISSVPGLIEIPGNRIIFARHNKLTVYNYSLGSIVNTYTTHNVIQYGHMDHNPLFASNGKIYGLTTADIAGTQAGENRSVLYSIDTTNFAFKVEYVLDSLIRTTNGRLTEYNGKLYGSTNFLGANNEGFLFSYDMVNGTFTNEHSFSRATDGGGFNAGWTLYKNKLYSTSRTAGQYGYGTLVEYNLTNSTFTTLKHLTMATGRSFLGTPVVWEDPVIISYNPTSGLVGATVTISGINFSATAADNIVKFNGVAAIVTASTTTSITTSVPTGATTGPVSVTVNGLTTAGSDFTVIPCTTPAKPVITASNLDTESPTLTSSSSSGNQWFLNGVAIAGATSNTLIVKEKGVYTVQVTVTGGCKSSMSDNFTIIITGDANNYTTNFLQVYPNPVEDRVFFQTSEQGIKTVKIIDSTGRLIQLVVFGQSSTEVDASSFHTGMYFYMLTTEKGSAFGKLIKK